MHFSSLDDILWAAGLLGQVALFGVLLLRGRWRVFPWFTSYIGFLTLVAVVLFLVHLHGSERTYSRVYWTADVADFVLQVGLILEMARVVLRPTGRWALDARRQFALWGGVGVGVAALVAWGVSPPGLSSGTAWEVRGSLFTSLVICELVVVMALSATRLGLGWRSHVMALGEGLGVWALVAVAVDGVQSFVGGAQAFATLDHFRMVVYCGALIYWTVRFWVPEPVRGAISPEMRDYLLALNPAISYDSPQRRR